MEKQRLLCFQILIDYIGGTKMMSHAKYKMSIIATKERF